MLLRDVYKAHGCEGKSWRIQITYVKTCTCLLGCVQAVSKHRASKNLSLLRMFLGNPSFSWPTTSFGKQDSFLLVHFLIHQSKSKGITVSLLLRGKMDLGLCFNQLAATLKGRLKEEGEEKSGNRETVSEVFLSLFLEKNPITSELISMAFSVEMQYFCWTKCKNLMEFPTQEWNSSSYCHSCLNS